jgi:hypothetical protein
MAWPVYPAAAAAAVRARRPAWRGPAGPVRSRVAREELFQALLRQVSEPGALNVVVVEDVRWADEATVNLMRLVGRRIENAGVLLIASYREEDLAAGDPLGRRCLSSPASPPPGGLSWRRCPPPRCGSWPGWMRPS